MNDAPFVRTHFGRSFTLPLSSDTIRTFLACNVKNFEMTTSNVQPMAKGGIQTGISCIQNGSTRDTSMTREFVSWNKNRHIWMNEWGTLYGYTFAPIMNEIYLFFQWFIYILIFFSIDFFAWLCSLLFDSLLYFPFIIRILIHTFEWQNGCCYCWIIQF